MTLFLGKFTSSSVNETFLNIGHILNPVGSERALYVLAFLLLFSTIFTADGPACGTPGCEQQITGQTSFSPNGISIENDAAGDFATISTANGSSMKIEKGALQKLQNGERVRLFVKKKKATAELNTTVETNITNTTIELPPDNSTNTTLPIDNSTNESSNTALNETTGANIANADATLETNSTLPNETSELNATLETNPSNMTVETNFTYETNLTNTTFELPIDNSINISFPAENPANITPLFDNSTNSSLNLTENESLNSALAINISANETPIIALPDNQSLRSADRGFIGEIILFYQKILLMMSPFPDIPLPSEEASPLPDPPSHPSAQVSIIAEFSSGDIVVESGIGGLAAIADDGADEVYFDYQLDASLSDTLPLIGASAAQSSLNLSGEGITICLLDTGVDFTEPSLNGTALPGYDFVNNDADASDDSFNGHGTKMASIIHSIAPRASILAVKVLDENGTGYASTVVAGMDYCMEQATAGQNINLLPGGNNSPPGVVRIISMSLGGGSYNGYCNSDPVAAEANLAFSGGMLVSAASGNNGGATIAAPACAENATAVAATTKNDTISLFSSINGAVDLLAPGESVTVLGTMNSGTSVSAAHVSGSAALLLQAEPSLTPSEIDARFKQMGKLVEYNGANYSRLDVYAALLNISGGMPTNQSVNNTNETQNVTYGALIDAPACGNNLSIAGTTYTMNISSSVDGLTCYTVTAANVTLDCAGYSITGNNSSSTYGIYSSQFNTTIKNCNISNFATGIYFNGATNGTIDGANISTTFPNAFPVGGYGIFLYNGANFNQVANNNVFSANGYSTFIRSSYNNTFTGLTTTGYTALYISFSDNNTIANSTATSNSTAQSTRIETGLTNTFNNFTSISNGGSSSFRIESTSLGNIINNSNISGGTAQSLFITTSSSNTQVISTTILSPSGGHGINVGGGSNVSIDCQGKSIVGTNTAGTYGIYSTQFNTTIRNCNINNFSNGIHFNGAKNGTIQNNILSSSWSGASATIYLLGAATDNLILNNTINDTASLSAPIYVAGTSSGNIINGNTIYGYYGIYTDGGSNNSIDCQGKNIVGRNASNTYGIYSTQFNTTIRNCNISNFAEGIYFNGASATNGTIDNVNSSSTFSTGTGIFLYNGANYNTISNSYGSSTGNDGIEIQAAGFNTVINSTGYTTAGSSAGYGIRIVAGANNNQLIGSIGNATVSSAIYVSGGSNVSIDCQGKSIIGTNTAGTYGVYSNNFNTTVMNCIIQNFSSEIHFAGATSSLIQNNTVSGMYAGDARIRIRGGSSNINIINNSITTFSNGLAGVYIDSGTNVNVDCGGRTIIGANVTGTYGIHSTQFNTTVRNCNISNFSSGIYFAGASNGTIENNSISITRTGSGNPTFNGAIVLGSASTYNFLNINNVSSTDGVGIIAISSSHYNIIANSTVTAGSMSGIFLATNSHNNTIINTSVISHTSSGIRIESCINSTITNSNVSNLVSGATGHGIIITSSSHNTQVINTTASSNLLSAIYIDGGSNVSIDCQGKSLVGTNTSGTYGVYSNQFNTTINNCNISNFATGIYFSGAANGTIENVSVSTSKAASGNDGYGICFSGASNNTIRNTNSSAPNGGYAIYLSTNSNYNALSGLTLSAATGTGAGIYSLTCSYNTFANLTATTTGYRSMVLQSSTFNNITNMTGTTATSDGLFIFSSTDNIVLNSNFTKTGSGATVYGIFVYTNSHRNQIINTSVFANVSSAIYIAGGSNVSIDCRGKSIVGTNSSGTYGIYSAQFNTTIKNCNISNFASAVGLVGATISLVDSNNLSDTNTYMGGAPYASTVFIASGGANNTISNNRITTSYWGVITQDTSSTGNVIVGNTINGTGIGAPVILQTRNNTVANNTLTGTSTNMLAFNSGINNTIINNTFASTGSVLVSIPATSSGNTFCLNNFTATTGAYISDTNGSNFYNCTYDGKNQGNAYANVLNGSIAVRGSVNSSISGLYIGTVGAGVPYSNTTASSGGKFSCNFAGCADYAPLTNATLAVPDICGSLSAAGTYTMSGNVSINGSTCFTIGAANVALDCAGFSITGNNSTGTYGIFSNQANTTIKNCNIQGFNNGIVQNGGAGAIYNNLSITGSMTGGTYYGSCIRLLGSANYATMQNIDMTCNEFPILLSTNNNVISNVTISGQNTGLYFYGSNNNIVTNLSSRANGSGAVYFRPGSNNTITGFSSIGGSTNGINIDTGQNNTIDCVGGSIIGTNSSGTYGIYSNQFNTTIKNCNISNFSTGIYFNAATNGTIDGANISTTFPYAFPAGGYGIFLYNGANYNTISNTISTSSSGTAIDIDTNSNNNSITNSTGNSSSYIGIYITSNSINNTITNSIGTSDSGTGIRFGAGFNTITNSTGTSNGGGYGIYILGSNNIITNTVGTSNSSAGVYNYQCANNIFTNITGASNLSYGILISQSSNNNTFINSTGISTTHNAIRVGVTSNNNQFIGTTTVTGTTTNSHGYYIDGGSNTSIDCQGKSIVGTNASGTYGIYSAQFNTTIKNCNINSFYNAINFYTGGATNGTIMNVNATGSACNGILVRGSTTINNVRSILSANGDCHAIKLQGNGNTLANSYAEATGTGDALRFYSSSNNVLSNMTFVKYIGGYAVGVLGASNNNAFLNLTTNASGTSHGIYVDSGSSVSIDCQGNSIVGANASGTYGIYSAQFNTTIKNCNISNFAEGIYFSGATNGTIDNITASSTKAGGYGIHLASAANYNTISNSIASSSAYGGIWLDQSTNNQIINSSATGAWGVYVYNSANLNMFLNTTGAGEAHEGFYFYTSTGNTLAGSTGSSTSASGISFNTGSNNNAVDCQGKSIVGTNTSGTYGIYSSQPNTTIRNCNISNFQDAIRLGTGGENATIVNNTLATTQSSGNALYLSNANNYCTIAGNTISANSGQNALYIYGGRGIVVANNTITGIGATRAIYTYTVAPTTNTTFMNNTLSSGNGVLAYISAVSSNNTFCLNNFTATTGAYINDLNGSNFYNCTYDGKNQGNIYANVLNGSIGVSGLVQSSIPGMYIGTIGAGVPYNNSTSGGKFSCNFAGCRDSVPLTTSSGCGVLSAANTEYLLSANASINGSTCFTIGAANVTLDCAGFSITGNNSTSTYGIYSNQTNTTLKNCIISNFSLGIQFSGATDGLIYNNSVSSTFNGGAAINITSGSHRAGITQNTILNGNASGILIVNSQNTSIDCLGQAMAGANSTQYGIYTDSSNTMIKNCIFNDFSNTIYSASTADGLNADNIRVSVNSDIGAPGYVRTYMFYINGSNSVFNMVNASYRVRYGMEIKSTGAGFVLNNSYINGYSYAGWERVLDLSGANTTLENTHISTESGGQHYGITFSGANSRMLNSSTASAAIYGAGVSVSAANFSMNCFGRPVSSIINGIVSTNFNTTVMNCNISSMVGINFTASDGLIYNNTITASNGGFGILINSSRTNITQNNITAGNSTGINIIGGQNTTVDCLGTNIIGSNYSGTYGIYSTQFNTTVKNCNISNFANAIYFAGASNGTIDNTNASSTKSYAYPDGIAIFLNAASYNTISNTNVSASDGQGILFNTGSNNVITNSAITSALRYGVRIATSPGSIINNSVVSTNTATAAQHGIYITSSSNNAQIINTSVTSNLSSSIYIDGGSNSSIDCQGKSLVGTNASGTYGIYSNQTNTTVKNCNVNSFGSGIFFGSGANNGTIDNTSVRVYAAYGGSDGYGIYLLAANYNIVNNDNISSLSIGVGLRGGSSYNTINNITSTATGQGSVDLEDTGTKNNTVINSRLYGQLQIAGGTTNNTIANNTINGRGTSPSRAIYLFGGTGNLFINNTILNATNLLYLGASASSNAFYWNNFSGAGTAPTLYVNDTNGSNFYNTTVNGHGEGNIYANVLNGSVQARGYYPSAVAGLFYSDTGTGVPYTNATSNGKFSCNFALCADYAPLTNQTYISCQNLTSPGTTYTMNGSVNVSGATCFSIQAANIVLECAGYSITGNNSSGTYGISIVNRLNATIRNCQISNFETAIFFNNGGNHTIDNTTARTTFSTGIGLYSINNANYNTIANSSFASAAYRGISLSSSSGNTFTNCTAESTINNAIRVESASSNNQFMGTTAATGTSANSHGYYITGGSNVSIDCRGKSIIGTNASFTYGIYSSQPNTSIRNCQIGSFQDAIRFDNATGGTIQNNTLSAFVSGGNAIRMMSGASRNNITGNALSADGTANGIYIDGGANVSVDCDGIPLAGGNGTGTYGIFSSQFNTTVSNCNIDGFQRGVAFDQASNGTIRNTTASSSHSSGYGIALYTGAVNNRITGSSGTAANGFGIYLSASSGNTFANSSGSSVSGTGVYSVSGANNTFTLTNGTSETGNGFALNASSNNTLSGAVASSTSGSAVYLAQAANGNTIAGTAASSSFGNGIYVENSTRATIECNGSAISGTNAAGTYGIYSSSNNTIARGCTISNFSSAIRLAGAANGLFMNNTIESNASGTVHISIPSGTNNTFYWNNITGTPGLYVDDSGSNSYNATVNGKNQGNVWANVISGEVAIQGTFSYGFGGLYIGTSGIGWPYNSANSNGKVAGNAVDYAPAIVLSTITYSVDAMQNGKPNIYFANGSVANITISTAALPSPPELTVRLANGTLLLANATMSGTGPYYYEFNIAATGWHSATIGNGSSAYTVPYLFYSGLPWPGNFTDPDGAIYPYRVPINVTEGNVVGRKRQPVEMNMSFPDGGAGENSFRLALWQGGRLVSIPLQVYNKNYTSGGKINAADIAFTDAFSLSQSREYYLFYAYSSMDIAGIGTDLSNNGSTFANRNFDLDVNASYGGTITRVKSAQNGFDLTNTPPAPMDTPVMDISIWGSSTSSSRAYNASEYHSSLTNGTVFTKYTGAGEVYAIIIEPKLMLNYTLTYTFYSGTDYFILETNASAPALGAVNPFIYSDSGIHMSKDRFSTYSYPNGSGMLAGANVSGISGASWLSFEQYAQKSGFGMAFINSSSNAAILPLANLADRPAGYYLGRQMFNGSGSAGNYFYSKNAYVIYDPTNSSVMNNTWLAILNPPIPSTGARESLTTSPPAYSLEGFSPPGANDTDNLTCFAKWDSAIGFDSAEISFNSSNYSETFTVPLSGTSAWSNLTIDPYYLQSGPGTCAITAYDIFGQSNTSTISFTIGDNKPPVLISTIYFPSSEADVDPNVSIGINATLAEFTDVDTAILQYNSTANGTLANVAMAHLENASHIYIYGANFTPLQEGNYTYRIWANDTLGNSNTSEWANIPVYYDWTWTVSPSSFSVVALFGTNASVASIILNNTGDKDLSFKFSSNYYDNARIFYNGTEEGTMGYHVDVPAGESTPLEVTATAKLQSSVDAVTLTASALNASADPARRTINGTVVSYPGGAFPFPRFTSIPSAITAGNASVSMNATLENKGNETAIGANFTWGLPSDWGVVSGQTHTESGNMAPGDLRSFQLTVSVPAAAQTGARTVSITGTSEGENKTNGAYATVTVISATPIPPVPGPSGGGGGGGGASNGTAPNITAIIKKVAKTLTVEQKEDYYTTLAGYDLVRGRDTSFDFNITNPFNAPLENITINVSGYLYQYISIAPSSIPSMAPRGQMTVKINMSAPSYFTEDTFTLYFDIRGTSVEETEDSLTTTKLQERRTVELKVLDMDRESAFRMLTQAYAIRSDMEKAGIFQGEATDLFNKANSSYSNDKFSLLKDSVNKLYDIYTAGLAASGQLGSLKVKLDDAKSNNIKTIQTNRLYTLANLAFERGDYANAQKLANDAELTYQLESVQGFSLEAFISKYGTTAISALFAIMLLSGCMFMGLRYWMMGSELTQLTHEEGIVLGMIKETQKDYFTGGKMSTEEYSMSSQQFDERLSKIIQRKVKLETDRKNYLNFSSKKDGLRMEKARLEQLMQGLQRDYLENGKIESGVYENRMKSYVTRLSEIEETIAVEETQDKVKSSTGLLDFLKPNQGLPAEKESQDAKEQKTGKDPRESKEKPSAKVQFSGKEAASGKEKPDSKEPSTGKKK